MKTVNWTKAEQQIDDGEYGKAFETVEVESRSSKQHSPGSEDHDQYPATSRGFLIHIRSFAMDQDRQDIADKITALLPSVPEEEVDTV